MSYNSTMMTSMESIPFSLSLMEGDLSFWSNDLTKNEFQGGASLDTTIQNMDALVTFQQDSKSSHIIADDQSNPLPEWMSEKIDVSNWLDDIADHSANQLDELEIDRLSPDDKLFNSFVANESISDILLSKDRLDGEPLMAASPGGSIGSGGSGLNSSAYSTRPSSPSSVNSDIARYDAFQETDLSMEDTQSFESLINSCKDADVFLQLAESLPMDLPMPVEADIKFLQGSVEKMQSDLQGKVKSESKALRGRSKSKGLSKERKERKKGQNKEAATRYRQKKKVEGETLGSELESLEKVNGDLQTKVSSLEQEIHYLKDLLQEIYKVKGQIQILQSH